MAGRHQDCLSHVIKQIGYHPDYLKEFLGTQNYLLSGDGPLRYDYRHYIAIMVKKSYMLLFFSFLFAVKNKVIVARTYETSSRYNSDL
ncbi:sestrin [Trichonephila clavipes]|nr:sestrin [Trichonephila clavipes]